MVVSGRETVLRVVTVSDFETIISCCCFFAVSGYDTVYEGSDREHQFEQLTPGHQYRVRVACCSAGGRSEVRPPFLPLCLAVAFYTHTHTHLSLIHI